MIMIFGQLSGNTDIWSDLPAVTTFDNNTNLSPKSLFSILRNAQRHFAFHHRVVTASSYCIYEFELISHEDDHGHLINSATLYGYA